MEEEKLHKINVENIYSRLKRVHSMLGYILDVLIVIAFLLAGIFWKLAK